MILWLIAGLELHIDIKLTCSWFYISSLEFVGTEQLNLFKYFVNHLFRANYDIYDIYMR